MFGIFNKSTYLVDQLEGMIDMHNHILPGIDDGAKNLDDSLALLRAFNAFGITDFIATPHIHSDLYPNTPESIDQSYQSLISEIHKHPDLHAVSIDKAAEHLVDVQYESFLDEKQIVPMKKQYMLVEMSFLQPSLNFDAAITKTQNMGYFPILAHPERYAFLHGDISRYQRYKSMGIYFQVNLLSLAGHYGTTIQKESFHLLKEGLVDFIGSDVHNTNHIQSLKKGKIPKNMTPFIKEKVMNGVNFFLD